MNSMDLNEVIKGTFDAIKNNSKASVEVEFDLVVYNTKDGKLNVASNVGSGVCEASKIKFKIQG